MTKPTTLHSFDLYMSAFLLASGARLEGLHLERNGRTRVAFVFDDSNRQASELQAAYVAGDAQVNALRLRTSLEQLKDLMFERLRAEETRSAQDRQGRDRPHQK